MSLRELVVFIPFCVLAGCTAKEEKVPANAATSGKAVVEAYADAWNRRDSTALDTLFAPGGTHEDIAQGFMGKNPGEVKSFMTAMLGMEPDYKWTLTNIVESGSTVTAEWTWTGTYTGPGPYGPAKNVATSGRGASVVEIENGKIKRITDYYDNASFFPKPPADTTKKG